MASKVKKISSKRIEIIFFRPRQLKRKKLKKYQNNVLQTAEEGVAVKRK